MKINYHNEDYSTELFNIIIYILILIFLIVWSIFTGVDIGSLIFIGICITFIIIMLSFSIRQYLKKKNQRNLNLFIMKEGKLIQGKIIRIYDNNNNGFLIENKKTIHNVTAEIEYTINNDRKTITVDHLAINVNRLDNYTSKQVKIYVYNNMSYIDIIN